MKTISHQAHGIDSAPGISVLNSSTGIARPHQCWHTSDERLLVLLRAARPSGTGNFIDQHTYRVVSRYRPLFEQVYLENRSLLPLVTAALWLNRSGPLQDADVVLWVKSLMRDAGLSEATWRYLVRHGLKFLRPVMQLVVPSSMFRAIVYFLQALQLAGLPPPPPTIVTRHWLRGFNPNCGRWVCINAEFASRADPAVIRAALREADRRQQNGALDGWIDEFLGVMHWARPVMPWDKNQRRGGWAWLVRAWQADIARGRYLQSVEHAAWQSRHAEERFGELALIPLTSAADVFDVATSLRNCLTDRCYARDCVAGLIELLVVRHVVTGRTVGCIGVDYRLSNPVIFDALGFANSPPKRDFKRVIAALSARLHSETERVLSAVTPIESSTSDTVPSGDEAVKT